MKISLEKIIASFVGGVIILLLGIVGFFAKETYATIKTLEKDIVSIRLKLSDLEAKRVSREEIIDIIKEYHTTHPCLNGNNNKIK
jgi:hypothetical protein